VSAFPTLRLGYLYPRLMNLYSDAGNVLCLQRRCAWRGITLRVEEIDLGEAPDFAALDIVFIGGGEDRQQTIAARDLVEVKGPGLRAALAEGLVALAVCGGYQLFAAYYRPADGEDLPGLGHFRAYTRHPGLDAPRCVGNVAARWGDRWLVGFENHGGRTTLAGSASLARVHVGHGNNGKDRTEGAVEGNAFGTYLHGSVLPKNPALADELLLRALRRRGVADPLPPLDDGAEERARDAVLARLHVGSCGGAPP
jgi:CobQ-like glutamine amidotransferase family enzyme